MNKKMLMWLLVGWLVAVVLPPQRVMGYFKGMGS